MAGCNTDVNSSLESTTDFDLGEIIFSRMPMGIAILDREFCIQRYNPTWAEFSAKYAPPESVPLSPGVYYFDHVAGSEEAVLPLYERALAGETVYVEGMKLEAGGVTSYWDVVLSPLLHDQKIVGILNVSVDATERILVQQNLEQRVIERTEELERRREIAESLKDILSVLNSSRSLEETLGIITEQACIVLKSQVCLVHKIVPEEKFVAIEASYGLPDELQSFPGFPLFSSQRADNNILSREPVWVSDFSKNEIPPQEQLSKLPKDIKRWRELTNKHYQAWLAVPLVVFDEVYGSLAFYYGDPQDFDDEKISLSQSFADQAALAIENTRLYQEVEKASIAAERNRLARDLHDAVTQTLFSSSMIADVLPKIWERDPEEGKLRLEELRLLTRGALSEMRTLLVELRPTALTDTNLKDLIQHQVNAFYARTGVTVEFAPQCQQDPPSKVKEMCYRITQEAFNNIAKHANASAVQVKLSCLEDDVSLEIIDDGIGFNLQVSGTEGLGLGIMRERAETIGGSIVIQSQVGKGTSLHITWSEEPSEEHTNES